MIRQHDGTPRGQSPRWDRPDRTAAIKGAVDLAQVVEDDLGPATRTNGHGLWWQCPMHDERSASFKVQGDRWHCFGSQHANGHNFGDVLDYLQETRGLGRAEVYELAARMAGLPSEWHGPLHPAGSARPPLRLVRPADAREAPERAGRELPPEAAERYLTRFVVPRGWDREVAGEMGLSVVLDQRGRPRVRFPYRYHGETTGYQDRLVLGDGGTAGDKWLNSSGGLAVPYNADDLEEARRTGMVVLTEGAADAVAIRHHAVRFPVVGAPGAHRLRDFWLPLLSGLVVFVIADNDAAGRRAREVWEEQLRLGASDVLHVAVPERYGQGGDVCDWLADRGRIDFSVEFAEELARAEGLIG